MPQKAKKNRGFLPLLNSRRRFQHIFNEDPRPSRRVVHHPMSDRAYNLAVLNDRRAAHECGQEGTTIFNKKFIFATIKCSFVENSMYLCSKFSI